MLMCMHTHTHTGTQRHTYATHIHSARLCTITAASKRSLYSSQRKTLACFFVAMPSRILKRADSRFQFMTLKWVHGMSFVIWTISLVQWLNVSGNMGQTQTITITVLMQTWPIPSEYTQGIGIRQTIPGQMDKEQLLTWYIFPVPAPRRTGVCASADLLAVFHTIYSLQSMYTGQKKKLLGHLLRSSISHWKEKMLEKWHWIL